MPSEFEINNTNSERWLREILSLVHPIMADAIHLAAIPHWYNLSLFSAIRNINDKRNEGLISRLENYSFVIPIASEPELAYRVRNSDRLSLHRIWIDHDAGLYTAAHRRSFDYWNTQPANGDPARDYERLYHLFFVDLESAASELIYLFRRYSTDRRLSAIEFLLDGVEEAYELLSYLHGGQQSQNGNGSPPPSSPSSLPSNLLYLAQLQNHLRARLAQMRGRWEESRERLLELRHTPALAVELQPYVGRAYANLLTREGKFVQAIHELEVAIQQFETATALASFVEYRPSALEQAMTMLALGDTYVEFARSVRGESRRDPVQVGLRRHLYGFIEFITSLPLVIYLSFYLGRRVWHPHFWQVLSGMDWIVGRLFALGAQQFRKAGEILTQLGTPEESLLADEKLAFLFLDMGDAVQANRLFTYLLDHKEASTTSYRLLLVLLGLADTQLQLHRPSDAQSTLQEVVIKLKEYADEPNLARAYALQAESALFNGDYTVAQNALAAAVDRYQTLDEPAQATNIQERMEALAKTLNVPPAVNRAIQEHEGQLSERRYTSGYRHPLFVTFRRIGLLLIPLMLVLLLLNAIHLSSNINLAPEFSFRAAPLLNYEDIQPAQLSQGITAANSYVNLSPRLFLPLALGALAIYLIGYAAVGVWIILDAPLRDVQETNQVSSISLDSDGLSAGTEDTRMRINWHDVVQLVLADTALWRRPIPGASSFTIKAKSPDAGGMQPADQEQRDIWITIGGSTNWYGVLPPRICRAVPETVEIRDLNHSILRSISGVVYIVNVLLLLLIALAAGSQRWGPQLWLDFPLTPYSIADFYPYLYLGLILLPIWWGVVRPLRIIRHTGRHARAAQYLLIFAGVLAAFIISRSARPLLTIPDLYPPLFVIITIISSAWLLWHLHPRPDRMGHARSWAIGIAALFVCTLMLSFAARDAYAYHFLIFGDTERDKGQAALLDPAGYENAETHFARALENYERALQVSAWPLWNIDPQRALEIPLGLPPQDNFIWILALKNAATLHTQAGEGSRAVELYTQLLHWTNEKDRVHIWRAIARQRAVTQLSISNDQEIQITRRDWYAEALDDYEEALARLARQEADNMSADALQLRKAQYTLWRGFTSHSLGQLEAAQKDYEAVLELTATSAITLTSPYSITAAHLRERALSGIGWLTYDQVRNTPEIQKTEQFRAAARWFEQAVELNPAEPEAWLGLGYARYSSGANTSLNTIDNAQALAELRASEEAWLKARELEPRDPVVHISLGTLYWKLAGLENTPARKCEEYTKAIDTLALAVDPAQMRPQQDKDIAYSYRTMGYIYYLLRNCATEVGVSYADKETVFRQAIGSFEQAILLDSDTGKYHEMLGRNAYALWITQPNDQRDYQLLYDAARALKSGGELGSPNSLFLNATLNELVPYALQQAEMYIQAGELSEAQEQLLLIVENRSSETTYILSLLHNHLMNPHIILAARPELDQPELQRQLQEMISELLQHASARWSFNHAINALADAEWGIAVPYFETGLSRIRNRQDVSSALDHFFIASTMRIAPHAQQAIVRQYRMALPRLEEQFIQNSDVDSLIILGSLAAVLEDMERAGRLYAHAIRLNVVANNEHYALLRNVWPPLLTHWQATGSTADTLLPALDEQLNLQLSEYPGLSTRRHYWGVRAWFKYWLGRAAFRAGDELSAQDALTQGQRDADQAFNTGAWVGNQDQAHTYLLEGAWAWYHIERGDDRLALGDLNGALADYEAALRENKADQDSTARSEKITAAKKAALAYVALGNMTRAVEAYQNLLVISAALGLDDVAGTAEDLCKYLLSHPEVDILLLYTEISRAEPSDELFTQLSDPASYRRLQAEFMLNIKHQCNMPELSDLIGR